jgi:hypothetical protein
MTLFSKRIFNALILMSVCILTASLVYFNRKPSIEPAIPSVQAVDDNVLLTTKDIEGLSPTIIAVTKNDARVDGHTQIILKQEPQYGSAAVVSINSVPQVQYYPKKGNNLSDSFSYSLKADGVETSEAKVYISLDAQRDSDSDGVLDIVESGDVNIDGLLDSQQTNVVAFANAFVQLDEGCRFNHIELVKNNQTSSLDNNFSDTFNFETNCLTSNVQVSYGIEIVDKQVGLKSELISNNLVVDYKTQRNEKGFTVFSYYYDLKEIQNGTVKESAHLVQNKSTEELSIQST